METRLATPDDVAVVVAGLRQRDRDEMAALFGEQYEAVMLQRYANIGAHALTHGPSTAAIYATAEHRRGVISLGLFGTDTFAAVSAPATRYFVKEFLPPLRARAHRMEALALSANKDTGRWLETLGLRPEGVLRKFGCNGEDFTMFAWVRG